MKDININKSIDIMEYIPRGKENAITRRSLCIATGLSDRVVRDLIADARRDNVIINLQDGKGYFVPGPDDAAELRAFYHQEEKRAKSIFWSLKMAREAMRKADADV